MTADYAPDTSGFQFCIRVVRPALDDPFLKLPRAGHEHPDQADSSDPQTADDQGEAKPVHGSSTKF